MKKELLLAAISALPEGIEIVVLDPKKNLSQIDADGNSAGGIYEDLNIYLFSKGELSPGSRRFAVIEIDTLSEELDAADTDLKIELLDKYFNHLPYCNKMKDWPNAQHALADCPDGPEKDEAYTEMYKKISACTCGMEDALKVAQDNFFTPEDITKVQELAYEAGFQASHI